MSGVKGKDLRLGPGGNLGTPDPANLLNAPKGVGEAAGDNDLQLKVGPSTRWGTL